VTGPLVTAGDLLADPGDALVLDATVELPRPRVDGDHRAASGAAGWAEAHIPGSAHLDLLGAFAEPGAVFHFAQPTPRRATAVLTALGARDGRPVVVYDRADGFWAARAWWSLRALGLPARVLDGGLAAWRAAGGAVVSGTVAGPAGSGPATAGGGGGPAAPGAGGPLTLRPRADVWATLDEVRAVAEGRAPGRLVCALAADQFAGAAPTRYARRGHIPGSVNLPARALTGADGLLLRGGALAGALAPLAGDGPLVLYCGGGVSASHLALGLVAAGREDVRLYDGSLEEWAARPDLPLVTDVPAVAGA
jgi:thiosulfate/3-mercaptopyruvate sulfurtransferase